MWLKCLSVSQTLQWKLDQYSISQHAHNFACWVAARAVQRGLHNGTTKNLTKALELCGIRGVVDLEKDWPTQEKEFDKLHKRWCNSLIKTGKDRGVNLGYGIAAKMIAMYIKTRIVVGGHSTSSFATYAHPPIDSLLLVEILKEYDDLDINARARIKNYRWTQADSEKYYNLINELRKLQICMGAFWRLECFWNASY
jgi:hypothetical protein